MILQVNILDSIFTYDYGKFVHIMDTEGNKMEPATNKQKNNKYMIEAGDIKVMPYQLKYKLKIHHKIVEVDIRIDVHFFT